MVNSLGLVLFNAMKLYEGECSLCINSLVTGFIGLNAMPHPESLGLIETNPNSFV